jgi:HAD superfamily hydrolase (TIGR01484 family)
MPLPLQNFTPDSARKIRAVLTDIDDTLTLEGRLPAAAYAAMEKLQTAGIQVLPVTGRPAGWCDHIARMWPIDGIVGENGAFYFRYDATLKTMQRVYAQSAETRKQNASKLKDIASQILKQFPGTAIASDQAYREIDIAIDFREDVPPLPFETAEAIADAFALHGATAKVSSIHVNAWFGSHDKLTMAKRLLAALGIGDEKSSVAYCGDSPNDAPMFGYFPNSIGVANIKPFLDRIEHQPRFVTKAEGGFGFAEFVELLLEQRA